MTAINMSFLEHTPFEMSELFKNVNDQKTSEYEVQHPKWEVYDINNYSINFIKFVL